MLEVAFRQLSERPSTLAIANFANRMYEIHRRPAARTLFEMLSAAPSARLARFKNMSAVGEKHKRRSRPPD